MKKAWLTPIAITGLLGLYVALYVWQPGGSRFLEIISSTLYIVFAILTTIFAWRASQMFEPGAVQRRAWLLFCVGVAMWAVAEGLWAYYQIALGEEIPYPSLADIVWAISYIPIVSSMVLQYRALGTGPSIRQKLGVLAIYFGLLVVAFVTVLWPALSSVGGDSIIATFLNLYYPLADLCLAFIATLSLVVLWGGLVGQPWRYIVLSMLLFSLADLTFSYSVWNDTYIIGRNLLSGVADTAYLAAYLLAAAGGYSQLTLRLPAADDEE
jgi:uncharacterized membrane protein